MSTQINIEQNEQTVLNFIKENLNNNAFVEKVKHLVSSDDDFDIPEWQQKEALNRLADYRKNPDKVLNFDAFMDELEARL